MPIEYETMPVVFFPTHDDLTEIMDDLDSLIDELIEEIDSGGFCEDYYE